MLIAEDERVIRNLLAHMLRVYTSGMEFETVSSGNEAVDRLLKKQDIDVVLIDLRMPGMYGEEAITRIREFSDVPVVVVSAYSDDKTRAGAAAAGANLFVVKPPDYRHLAGEILRLTTARDNSPASRAQMKKLLLDNLLFLQQQAAMYGPMAVPLPLHNQIATIEQQIKDLPGE